VLLFQARQLPALRQTQISCPSPSSPSSSSTLTIYSHFLLQVFLLALARLFYSPFFPALPLDSPSLGSFTAQKPKAGTLPLCGPSPRLFLPALGPVLVSVLLLTGTRPVVLAASSAHWAPHQGLGCWVLGVQESFWEGTAPPCLEAHSRHCLGWGHLCPGCPHPGGGRYLKAVSWALGSPNRPRDQHSPPTQW
jgi:hypothetical protein